MKIINPATGEVLRDVDTDTPESVARKFEVARAAQAAWAGTGLEARMAPLARFRALLAERMEECAETLTSEMGKPITQSRNEIRANGDRIGFFLEHAPVVLGTRKVRHDAASGTGEEITLEPLGVIANVSAWNYPYFVGTNVFVPALLTGNAVLYKPSEYATLTGLKIAELLHEAGVPQDVFQVVVGGGDVGAALVAQPVDGVFFTGSHATGQKIAAQVAGRFCRLQLELGGKDPVYVTDDVDPAKAAAAVADGAFYNAGQSCCGVERIYVHRKILDPFLDAMEREAMAVRMGDPRDPDTYLGPLTRRQQLEVLAEQVEDALARGARLLTGGKRSEEWDGWWEPTVLSNCNHEMLVMREESFGPIVGIMAVDDDDEAVHLMNDTRYGLTAGVYTKDEARARRLLSRVRAGTVYWNCCDRVSPYLPWSGRGDSGIGLTLSTMGIEAFTVPKAWHLRK